MISLLEAYFDRLQALHADVAKALQGLQPAALDWVAGPDMNSLVVLVVHLTGSERFWIGDLAGQDPAGRDRAAEFRTQGWDVAALTKRLDETLTHSKGVLARLALADLDAQCVSPWDGRKLTVAWCLAHALEHTALHLGHVQIMRQLWEKEEAGEHE